MIELDKVGRCSVTVDDKGVQVAHQDYGTFDVSQSLMFGDDINVALNDHSPQAVWWATMASEEGYRLRLFQEGLLLRYMSHCRYFAKLALKGLGDKETLEAVKDYVVILFSKDKPPMSRSIIYAAWYGSLLNENHTATAVKKLMDTWAPEVRNNLLVEFTKTMYTWETDHGVTYDDIVLHESDILRNVEVLRATAEQFKQRGVLLSTMGGVKKAEFQALGVGQINGFNRDMNERTGGKKG